MSAVPDAVFGLETALGNANRLLTVDPRLADEQAAEAVEPAMADLDHPAPRLLGWIAPLGISLRAAADDMRDVAVRLDDLQCPPASIPSSTKASRVPDVGGGP